MDSPGGLAGVCLRADSGLGLSDCDSLIAPPDAEEIDAGGRMLMPGLINAHAHVMLQLPVW